MKRSKQDTILQSVARLSLPPIAAIGMDESNIGEMQTSSQLIIGSRQLRQIINHALRGHPYEVCGLAGGRDWQVETVVEVPNASLTPQYSFEMEQQGMVDVIISFQRAGQEVVAIYHSHPDGEAIPSQHDINQVTGPDAGYLIVGLTDPQAPDVRGWMIRRENAKPVEVELVLTD